MGGPMLYPEGGARWRSLSLPPRSGLPELSNQILELTRAIHAMNTARSPTGPANPQVT